MTTFHDEIEIEDMEYDEDEEVRVICYFWCCFLILSKIN